MEDAVSKIEQYFLLSGEGEIYKNVIMHVEKDIIVKALERCDGNQLMAAKMLGLNRNTLHLKLKKLDIDAERFKK
ncbi:MAG: helix-turn-helix domain-containing protein [Candidatus Omnitrophota bacterium]